MKALIILEFDNDWLNRAKLECKDMIADITIYRKESLENQCDYTQRIYKCWSPIKRLPHMPYGLQFEECDGWRACIKAITGEEEE